MTNLEFNRIIFIHTENNRIDHDRNRVEIAYQEDDQNFKNTYLKMKEFTNT